jgi:hypothetical protein
MPRIRIEDTCPAGPALQRGRKAPEVQPPGFLTNGAEGFTRVVESLLRAAR